MSSDGHHKQYIKNKPFSGPLKRFPIVSPTANLSDRSASTRTLKRNVKKMVEITPNDGHPRQLSWSSYLADSKLAPCFVIIYLRLLALLSCTSRTILLFSLPIVVWQKHDTKFKAANQLVLCQKRWNLKLTFTIPVSHNHRLCCHCNWCPCEC